MPSYFIGLCRFSFALEGKRRLNTSVPAQQHPIIDVGILNLSGKN
jgi:hypothetical protein